MMAIVDTYTNGIFVQKELVNLEKNSIYISYERFKIDRSRKYVFLKQVNFFVNISWTIAADV
jgi:hypothetical protein